MTIDQGGDKPAVCIPGEPPGVLGAGSEAAHTFIAFPVALDMHPFFVEPPASEAMRVFFRVIVLERFSRHDYFSRLAMFLINLHRRNGIINSPICLVVWSKRKSSK
jgi:hypothetical protein